ncbi:hypothetical protein NUU61_005512 [Penicillium alfredii]|uniref:LysM domain-containing protein n=1 Tax=Penicillium alfredii TaxID=1506179 RepID=A0A9W9F9N1_9EURO|nr:uncharacterized protein NUU61_005512 [Penicillium alfredii]KAJ5096156.1 hypothetical protein NUU61_005512 [Penicillium alfredii]
MSSQNSFGNASLGSNTVSAGNATSSSTVRSRPRRLVSLMDDDDDSSDSNSYAYQNDSQPFASGLSSNLSSSEIGATRSRGATPSPLSSRGVSPMPMKHPSRANASRNRSDYNEASLFGWNGSSKASSSRGAADFLDSSWSSLQSLASSVLGSESGRSTPNNTTNTHTRRKPSRSDKRPSFESCDVGSYDPSIPEVGAGTKEERQAFVQAKKREALLLADADPMASPSRRHKRRDSGDYFDQGPDPDQDEDALAYIHHVQSSDTITGVTIKYGCQPAIFRKANGFWPSDSVQSRKTVLLPVDACSVKGRPIRPTESTDLLDTDSEDPNDSSIAPASGSKGVLSPGPTMTSSGCEAEANRIWKHESSVEIDGFSAPVEIGRVPRRALGFFPRTRRKSTSYTDAEPLSISSREATRDSSPYGSPQPPSSPGILPRTRIQGDQPSSTDTLASRSRHRRQRSSIHLTGTGVGTLDHSSTAPGPALDGLSRFFAQHMPALAPPQPPPNVRRSSFDSASTVTSNASTGLENIGGALEGWVRKVTIRAKAGINELQQGPTNQQGSSRGRNMWGFGDLIELDDAREERQSPSPLRAPRRSDLQGTSSSSSSFRLNSPSASAASRSRAAGFGSGSAAYGERVKDD